MPSGGALGDSEALTLLVGDCSILFGNQLRIPQLYQAPGTQSTTLSYVKGWRSEHPFPAGKSGCHSFTAPHPGTVLPVPRHPDEGSCQPLANSPRPEGCRQLVRNVNKLETRRKQIDGTFQAFTDYRLNEHVSDTIHSNIKERHSFR